MSFHPDPETGLDDLDVTILKYVEQRPGISIKGLTNRISFYNKDDPSEEVSPNYWLMRYRVETLERNSLLVTRREPNKKAMLRRCYPP